MAVDVLVRFLADTSKITQGVAEVEGTGSKLKGWAKGVGAAIGVAFAVDQLKAWTDAAADLQDAMGATDVIFGRAAKSVVAFASDSASAFGIAKSDALVAAGNFGTLGKAAGLSGDDLAQFSTGLVGLAGDLASFKGTSTEEAVTAVGAALRGESEPIRKYGVLLDDATLRNRALAMGLIATTKDALTPQQKALAAHAEILAQTKDAQGDFGRTSDSAANQQKAFAANLKDTQAALGTALLPVLQAVLPVLREIAKFIGENASVLVPLAAAIGLVVAAQWAWNAAMLASPLTLIVLGIAAVVAAIVLLIKNWDTVKEVAVAVWDAILSAVQTVWNWISTNWPTLLAILTGPFGIAVLLISRNWDTIKDAVSDAIAFMRGVWDGFVGFLRTIPGRIADAFSGVYHLIVDPWTEAIGFVKGLWNGFARGWNQITIKIPSVDVPLIGEVGGGSVNLPNLPMLARGGIVTGPTLALIGERGPEAVVPLDSGGGRFGGSTYNISVNVPVGASPSSVGGALIDAIRAYERVNGSTWRAS